ncbi:MAG: hypothetical protein PVI23_00340 [Maricaulaceae bacterium]|jgi:hypothetical protein
MKVLTVSAALLLAALAFGSPAAAQPGPTLAAEATLSDGRQVEVITFGDGGYRFGVVDSLFPRFADGLPVSAHVDDVDHDGAEDVVVLLERGENGLQPAHVWDVTTEQPFLMHVTSDTSLPDDPIGSMEWDVARRFSIENGLEELEELRAEVADGELAPQERDMIVPNLMNTLEGVMRHRAVADARAAFEAAPSEEARQALEAALIAREEFALARSGMLFRDAIEE